MSFEECDNGIPSSSGFDRAPLYHLPSPHSALKRERERERERGEEEVK